MKWPAPYPLLVAVIVGLILLACLGISGCQEETPTSCPDYAVGAIEGYTLSVGQPVSVDIQARLMSDSSFGGVVASTTSDSTGWYRFDVPSGLYRLEVDPGDGNYFTYEQRDTVRVRQTVRRYDLWRGRVEVQVVVPDEFEGEDFELRLIGDSRIMRVEATVQSGHLLFVFPFKSVGSYKMGLSVPDQGQIYLPGSFARSEGYSLIVGTDEVARYEVDFSNTYASVSGVVVGSWQQVEGSRMVVTLHDSNPSGFLSRGKCDDDGAFTCGIFVPGSYKVKTSYSYSITQWVGGDSFETAQVFDVQPGDRITGISVVDSGIAVRLEWPGDQIGSRPWLMVRDENDQEQALNPPGNNPYYVCNLRSARYYLRVDRNCGDHMWSPRWFGGAEEFEDAEPIDLVAGELREISVSLVEGGRIEGEVRDHEGRVPSYADYQIYHTDGVPLCDYWEHWPGSLMLFSGVLDGTYLVAARDADYQPWYHPGTHDMAEATRIVVEDHQTVSGLVWTLPEETKGATP